MLTDKSVRQLFARYWARGYIVVASQYPGIDGGSGKDEFGGEQDYNAIEDLLEIVKQLDYVDSDRIFVYGVSRGGMMAYMLARKHSDLRGVIVRYGISDLLESYSQRETAFRRMLNELIGNPIYEHNKYNLRSAIYTAIKGLISDAKIKEPSFADIAIKQKEQYYNCYRIGKITSDHDKVVFTKYLTW